MIKTCMNCKKFVNTLSNPDNPNQHIHYWCNQWNTVLNGDALSEQVEHDFPYYDDLETGEAYCYMFEPADMPRMPDEWFEKNKSENQSKIITCE